jgi:pyruvate/2-oxoglutarate dehydrogenase complex dihydrolipoamide dehydrogenase (E3) component
MATTTRYDIICLGGGTAGMTAARIARVLGANVALVEREEKLGGECTFFGCVPSKTLIEAARLFYQFRNHAPKVGIYADNIRLDFNKLMSHKDNVIADINRDESDASFEEVGIGLIKGRATFLGPHEIQVNGATFSAERFVLAQGTDPLTPAIAGLDTCPHVTNETVFSMAAQPKRLIVLGGGPIGLELGQCFLRLGSEVVSIAKQPQLLPREDPEVGSLVKSFLEREGMELHLDADADTVSFDGSTITIEFTEGGQRRQAQGDQLLVATGRTPRLGGLGLDKLGVTTNKRGVPVDERCRTNLTHVWAAGDITGQYLFTHAAALQGRVAGSNAAGKRAKADYRVLPWVTFLDPEVARVGLTEPEARAKYKDVEVVRFPFSRIDRARTMLETEGWIKLVTAAKPVIGRAAGGELVGAHIVGVHAGEMLHEAVLSMQARTFAGRLAQAVHAYPTLALGMQQAAGQLFAGGRALSESAPLEAMVVE